VGPFDQLLLADARPSHPMCFFLECHVSGELAFDRFCAAVGDASGRHPRLRSRLGRQAGRPVWLSPDVSPTVVVAGEDDSDPWRGIDLTRESGVRVVLRPVSDGTTAITLVVHHAVCDGIAACEFFGDVWASYGGVPARKFSPGRSRNSAEAVAPQAGVLREAVGFATFRPAALVSVATPPAVVETPALAPPFAVLTYDAVATSRLRDAARRRGATVNDLVLAAVARACLAWNEGAGRRSRGVRITMPVSTRLVGAREPACNGIGYAFLDRRRTACHDRDALVTDLAAASRWIVSSGAAERFNQVLAVIARWPWALRLVTRLPGCLSTVIVSNLGDVGRRMRTGTPQVRLPDRSGSVTIVGFAGVPPLRPGTRAAVAVLGFGDVMNICCASSAMRDPRTGGRAFLALVARELDALV